MAYRFGRRQRIYEQCTEDSRSRTDNHWMLLLCLIGLLTVIVMSIFLTIFLLYKHSSHDSTDMATVGTLTSLQIPQPSLPMTPPSTGVTVQQRPMVTAKPAVVDIPSFGGYNGTVCASLLCHVVAQWLRSKLDSAIDPCQDFYHYVCRTFRGTDHFTHAKNAIQVTTTSYIKSAKIPPTKQTSWQKAAGLFQACVAFGKSYRKETEDLVAWMKSLKLDLANERRLARVRVVDMIVRCAIDFGIQVIFSITFDEKSFHNNKRAMQLAYSHEQEVWQEERRSIPRKSNLVYYVQQLRWFNVDRSGETVLASRIMEYEHELHIIVSSTKVPGAPNVLGLIGGLGAVTQPHVKKRKWIKVFSKYTNNTYRGKDNIVYKHYVLNILVKLIRLPSVSYKGLRYLIAWSVFRQMVNYTDPKWLVGGRRVEHACYDHVLKVMKLAVISPLLKLMVTPNMVEEADRMVTKIRKVFRSALKSSNWITGEVRKVALRKLANLKQHVGSPGKRHDPVVVEQYYQMFPDVPSDQFFTPWRKALSLSSHQKWADQTTWLYDESATNAHYSIYYNSIIIPTAMLQRPFFFYGSPPALNYGGIGTVAGHEIMHMYDVLGITYDKNAQKGHWVTPEFLAEYAKRVVCVRRSNIALRKKVARQETAKDVLDSENLADFVGTAASYSAYASLPPSERQKTLLGLNIAAERLFFINHCVKYCNQYSDTDTENYSPFHVRCEVPLMHMPEFSTAFRCAPGSHMNPRNKCAFWS